MVKFFGEKIILNHYTVKCFTIIIKLKTNNMKTIKSNCLIEAIKLKIKNPSGTIGYDFNSPSGSISFYFIDENYIYRFRRNRKIKHNNSKIYFEGYRVLTPIKSLSFIN